MNIEEPKLIQISDTVYASEEDLEKSKQAAELFQSLSEHISPIRLLAASLVVLLLISSIFAIFNATIPAPIITTLLLLIIFFPKTFKTLFILFESDNK